MEPTQKNTPQKVLFIDYVPAEVKKNSGEDWRIVFYVKKPGTNELKRFRRRVKKIDGEQNRMCFAKKICKEINQKLAEGWTPFIDNYTQNEYHLLTDVMDMFMSQGVEAAVAASNWAHICAKSQNTRTTRKLENALQQIEDLRKELRIARLLKNSSNSSLAPSSDLYKPKRNKNNSLRPSTTRKLGGQLGHQGATLEFSTSPAD